MHSNVSYFINNLPNIASYLELGVFSNATFNNINLSEKYSVDINGNAKYTGTCDQFFAQNTVRFDSVFIDANHDVDYVVRDYNNSIKIINKLIIIHDMVPPTEAHTVSGQCSDSYKLLYYFLMNNVPNVYTLNDSFGTTFIKQPSPTVDITDIDLSLNYNVFMSELSKHKRYSDEELLNILKEIL